MTDDVSLHALQLMRRENPGKMAKRKMLVIMRRKNAAWYEEKNA